MTHTARTTRVKICGITTRDDRDAVVASGADALGVISGVTVETPREIDEATATDLVAGTPPFVTSVLVTMPETVEQAVHRIEVIRPDAVQIHDGLSPAELATLRKRCDVQLLAAVDAESAALADYAAVADALLVDSLDVDGGGGTGTIHDWERARGIVADLDVPVVLAGGLTPDNVVEAIETVEPFGVDVASGVESSGGIKDHDAVEQFVVRTMRARTGVSA